VKTELTAMSQRIHHTCTASLIVIGDEILRGQIIDTNCIVIQYYQ